MSEFEPSEGHRSGFVAVIGRPSVGKSTLINAYLGQTIAPVSPRPQTTRRRQLGILTLPEAQVIFIDTPGIHVPRHKLGEVMNAAAEEALRDADVLLVIFDLTHTPTPEDERVAEILRDLHPKAPVLVALNKTDDVPPSRLTARQSAFQSLIPQGQAFVVSALRGDGRAELLERLIALLPPGPRYYPPDTITDAYERTIAAELIRAAAMHLLRDEVPHGISVRIDEYTERNEHGAYIVATLFVERESHKPIVIGRGGAMLRKIGTRARQEIETMSGRKVYLEIRVKVEAGWRDDENALKRFGFLE
jgi:GTP-binding protein Era